MPKPAEILLIEDNPGDVRLMQEALKLSDFPHHLNIFQDGLEALAFLEDDNQNEPKPDLIILDLKLPKKEGSEILAEIKASPQLRNIPVIILTSSKSDKDILRCYELNANCYVTKPVLFQDLQQLVKMISRFWFGVATLPRK